MPPGLGRLRSAAEFERVRREGGYWRGRLCAVNAAVRAVLRSATEDERVAGPARVGYITSRKIGTAVQRNRARRLLRESIRRLASRLLPEWDIVLIARRDLCNPGVRMRDVQDELIWLLNKARIVIPPETHDQAEAATSPSNPHYPGGASASAR